MASFEDFIQILKLYHNGVSVSEIARLLKMDHKTVRKYLRQLSREYKGQPRGCKVDPLRMYLRERWEAGEHNASRLFGELRKRGYEGYLTQMKKAVRPWRSEGRERAFVRFETAPGEQAQMDWVQFGKWSGRRLYGFALMLCWSRMQYVAFAQGQDAETLLTAWSTRLSSSAECRRRC